MAGLSDAMEVVLAAFRGVQVNGAPLRAVSDPADVNPPCVFVPPPDMAFQFHKGRAEVTWSAYLVAPTAPRPAGGLGHLATILDALMGLFPYTTGDLYSLT